MHARIGRQWNPVVGTRGQHALAGERHRVVGACGAATFATDVPGTRHGAQTEGYRQRGDDDPGQPAVGRNGGMRAQPCQQEQQSAKHQPESPEGCHHGAVPRRDQTRKVQARILGMVCINRPLPLLHETDPQATI